jgi:hypothetical protein
LLVPPRRRGRAGQASIITLASTTIIDRHHAPADVLHDLVGVEECPVRGQALEETLIVQP